ncbi:hypothetical protein AHAS_Ahas15G0288500 [Arachis hypogaea]
MLRGWFNSTGWDLLVTTRRSTISIALACIVEWSSPVVLWRVLLPKGWIKSSWLHPSLTVPTLMHVPAIASIPFNNIRTKLKARGVRIHSE